MSVAVTIEAIEKRFENFPALRGVSLDIQPGELVALLGPSGSGKTTLLRLIAGLEEADRGRVLFGETNTRDLSLRERRIGFVFQQYALFKTMNVADNIAFGLRSRPRDARPDAAEIRKRVKDLLELVQLPGLDKRYPSQLSGGQRQRVALARALAIEPRGLLLDEPFGALDAKVRKDLRAWLRELHGRTGHTTVFVTHDQEEALELADRVAILNDGRIEQVGSADDVYDHPATPFVCEFLGEVNKLPVKVVGSQAFFDNRPVLGGLTQNQGGAAALYVRPQHLRIVNETPLALPGTVEHLRRNGPLRRAEVAIDGLKKRLDVDLASQVAPAIGERVKLRITHGNLFAAA
ncbi:MAG: sulfate/molybdate ABC transporter ATP-binding protein [Bosea sp. (in: a-proteobacteria)]|uniref:sulfate/molybdate ABC transporter ATP-binding protein n=1 Tax=Bosea sp. (in: a-proteobacteria) TaxID=1871050 RepID=UPI003F7C9CDC